MPGTRTALAVAAALLFLSGCRREPAQPRPKASSSAICASGPGACAAGTSGAASRPSARAGRVARLVFIDLEKSCPCTKRRIASSLKALDAVLGPLPTIPLERYHLDTQDAQADRYVDTRPIVVAPGLYLLDKAGNIVDLLQGEMTEQQLRAAIR